MSCQFFVQSVAPLQRLILDVIDEMSKPTAYQEPAEAACDFGLWNLVADFLGDLMQIES